MPLPIGQLHHDGEANGHSYGQSGALAPLGTRLSEFQDFHEEVTRSRLDQWVRVLESSCGGIFVPCLWAWSKVGVAEVLIRRCSFRSAR